MVVVEVPNSIAPTDLEMSAEEDLVRKLEYFFMSPDLLTSIGDFMHESVQKLYFVGAQSQENTGENVQEETHPIENYEIFRSYGDLIEKVVLGFLEEQGANANDLYTACLEEKVSELLSANGKHEIGRREKKMMKKKKNFPNF